MSMNKFISHGDGTFKPTPTSSFIIDNLPAGRYRIEHTMYGPQFVTTGSMELPERIYGPLVEFSDKVLRRFRREPTNLGVLMDGNKGSGKTLLSELIASRSGLPIIEIESTDDALVAGTLVGFPMVLLLDEFEKKFCHERDHVALLGLLDSTGAGHRLSLLTSNNGDKTTEFLHSRPGRIRYKLRFNGIDPEVIRAYVREHLLDQSAFDEVCSMLIPNRALQGMDAVAALVEEVNSTTVDDGVTDAPRAAHVLNVSTNVSSVDVVRAEQRKSLLVNGVYFECTLSKYNLADKLNPRTTNSLSTDVAMAATGGLEYIPVLPNPEGNLQISELIATVIVELRRSRRLRNALRFDDVVTVHRFFDGARLGSIPSINDDNDDDEDEGGYEFEDDDTGMRLAFDPSSSPFLTAEQAAAADEVLKNGTVEEISRLIFGVLAGASEDTYNVFRIGLPYSVLPTLAGSVEEIDLPGSRYDYNIKVTFRSGAEYLFAKPVTGTTVDRDTFGRPLVVGAT